MTPQPHPDGIRCGDCPQHKPNPAEDGHTEQCLMFHEDVEWENFGGDDVDDFQMVRLPQCRATPLNGT